MSPLSHKILLGFAIGLCGGGCFFGSTPQEQETKAYVAEEHLHHELPEHMPRDFPDAVREIDHRDEHLREDLAAGHLDHVQEELAELLDIVGWLPGLAADSDLNKQEWEQVRDGARALESLYRPLMDADRVPEFLQNSANRETVTALLSNFEALVEKYPDGFEPVLGGHDHDHHDH